MPQNHRMVEVFRESGFPVEISALPGSVGVELPTSLSAAAVERFEERDRLAAEAAVRRFLRPRAVAVVGASRRRGTVGGEVFHNLLDSEFDGVVHPVNPAAEVVQAVRAYPDVAALPDGVDLAVDRDPGGDGPGGRPRMRGQGHPGAGRALGRLRRGRGGGGRARARAGRGLPRGRHAPGRAQLPRGPQHRRRRRPQRDLCAGGAARRQRRLRHPERRPRPRPDRPRLATAASASPPSPRSATAPTSPPTTSSSSGRATRRPRWRCSTSSPSATRAASRGWPGGSAAEKPIVAVKSGRSVSGARATGSHTGALLSASDVTVDALFEQAGVIRTETLAELLRRLLAALGPAAAGRAAGRDPDQRGRPGDHVRRRLRGGRGSRSRSCRRRCAPPCASSSRPRPRSPTRST